MAKRNYHVYHVLLIITNLLLQLRASRAVDVIQTNTTYQYTYLEDHGIDIEDRTHITFSVRAKNDVHVILSQHTNTTSRDAYEVVIGGWSNTKSVIRECSQCANLVSLRHSPLDESEARLFWVSWDAGFIQLGNRSTPYMNELLSWQDLHPHSVNHVGISTGFGANGTWYFTADTPLSVGAQRTHCASIEKVMMHVCGAVIFARFLASRIN